MGLYEQHVLPRLVDHMCGVPTVGELRADVIPLATGRVLEVGFGSGHNLPWYDPERIERVIGLEPAEAMWARARERIARAPFPVEPLALEGEEIPLPARSVDSVVVTFTLCTIPDPHRALAGMRRVLRPGGRLLFCEHGRAPEPGLARWQRRIEPLWRRVFGGCHLARDVPALLREGGFTVERMESGFVEGAPRIAGWGCRGVARPA